MRPGIIACGLSFGLLASAACLTPAAARPSPEARSANFGTEAASGDARAVANWVATSGDNRGLPFVIVDKIDAKVFVFDATGALLGAAPALLAAYRETFEKHAQEIEGYCRKYGWGYARALTDVPFEDLVLRILREEGLLR